MKHSASPMGIFESVFDIVYLLFDLTAGVIFLVKGNGERLFVLYGILALLLGAGDAFHLVPRVRRHLKGEEEKTEFYLGLGLQVSSITMTIYYLILYAIAGEMYAPAATWLAVLMYASAFFRIIICFFPQNNWYHYAGSAAWSRLRNVPFLITGLCMIAYLLSLNDGWGVRNAVAIAVSFACYLPVTLYAKKYPAVGSLMMPKTLAYVAMIIFGLKLL